MIRSPFLTELDSRAEVKGSRDPLGLVPLWGRFGRQVVGNLTTVTGSVRGFTTTLLGYYFARQVQEKNERSSPLASFLKFEQLAAFSRLFNRDAEFRGVLKAQRMRAEGTPIRLSTLPADQILSNQKVYGLWGLFTVPSRASGLLDRDELVLSSEASAFVEEYYIQALSKAGFRDGRAIVELLHQERPTVHLDGKHRDLGHTLAGLLGPKIAPEERAFYWRHLAAGGPDTTEGKQPALADLMRQLPADPFDRAQLRQLLKAAARDGLQSLAQRLERIDQLESVLVPAIGIFGLVLDRDRSTPTEVSDTLSRAWKRLSFVDVEAIRSLRGEVAAAFASSSAGDRWVSIAEGLHGGDFTSVIRLLLEHNAEVMASRGGAAPWVQLEKGHLDIRVIGEARELRDRSELPNAWVNNYFLNPLKQVVSTLREA